jgi:hypothetical protein
MQHERYWTACLDASLQIHARMRKPRLLIITASCPLHRDPFTVTFIEVSIESRTGSLPIIAAPPSCETIPQAELQLSL